VPSGNGGIGRKRRNAFEPKKTKTSPRKMRALMVKIFMAGDGAQFQSNFQP
jgi:hypothetical protein